MTTTSPVPLLTKKEVAALLRCSERSVQRRRRQLGVRYPLGPHAPRFPLDKVQAHIERKRVA